jgi:hypothetical protein
MKRPPKQFSALTELLASVTGSDDEPLADPKAELAAKVAMITARVRKREAETGRCHHCGAALPSGRSEP